MFQDYNHFDDLGLRHPEISEEDAEKIKNNPPFDEDIDGGAHQNTNTESIKPARKPDVLGLGLKTDNLFVKDTGNEQVGRGLYASKNFETGDHIFEFDGFKRDEKFHPIAAIDGRSAHAIVVGHSGNGNYFVYAMPDGLSPLRYLNHSCDPNVARLSDDLFGFVAIKPIKLGDEITADYSLLEVNPYWEMEGCGCGSKNCRHKIGSVSSLSSEDLCRNWQSLTLEMRIAAIEFSRDPQIAALRNRLGAEYMRDRELMNGMTFEEIQDSVHPSTIRSRNHFGAMELANTFLEELSLLQKAGNAESPATAAAA